MVKQTQDMVGAIDEAALEEKCAEEAFILLTQTEIQRILNLKGLRYRDLSKRLGVSEARVSQMFGDSATNLTIRTIARIFYHLGETAFLTTDRDFDKALSAARGSAVDSSMAWTVSGFASNDFEADTQIVVEALEARRDTLPSKTTLDWAKAEQSADSRRDAA